MSLDSEWTAWVFSQVPAEYGEIDDKATSPAMSEMDQFLEDMKRADKYVGYVGARVIRIPFEILCKEDEKRRGTLVAWDRPTVGILACSRTPSGEEISAMAKQFC
ncbi:hypothetical protein [Micromonospora sonneratiae]|uniref:Uncharacterized protein n=1 Tax=Micromonospora sonneratiae TaxID=1184706 RepID=A0ABW3YRA9_9ACTN